MSKYLKKCSIFLALNMFLQLNHQLYHHTITPTWNQPIVNGKYSKTNSKSKLKFQELEGYIFKKHLLRGVVSVKKIFLKIKLYTKSATKNDCWWSRSSAKIGSLTRAGQRMKLELSGDIFRLNY